MTLQRFNPKALVRDVRGGSEMVQFLILVICVALFSLAAFQAFGGKVKAKVDEAANKVPTIN
jgi:hypothetical protein